MPCLFTRLPFSENHRWDEPVDIYVGDGVILSKPQPHLFFGLKPALFEGSTASNRIFLKGARDLRQLHRRATFELLQAFPLLVFEGRPDTDSLFFAENEAAG